MDSENDTHIHNAEINKRIPYILQRVHDVNLSSISHIDQRIPSIESVCIFYWLSLSLVVWWPLVSPVQRSFPFVRSLQKKGYDWLKLVDSEFLLDKVLFKTIGIVFWMEYRRYEVFYLAQQVLVEQTNKHRKNQKKSPWLLWRTHGERLQCVKKFSFPSWIIEPLQFFNVSSR